MARSERGGAGMIGAKQALEAGEVTFLDGVAPA
jgi:hypothetical protein